MASLTVLVLATVTAACQAAGPVQEATTSASPDPRALTCAAWLRTAEAERVAVAERLVGDSADLLERIRRRQHQPEGSARENLVRQVVASLTKNCEVWPPRERPVGGVMHALYLAHAD